MKKQLIAIFLIAATLSGCKDFFDISNPQTLTTDNFPATMEQVDQLVTAAYAQDHSIGLYAFYWFPMGVWLYDHTTDIYGSYDERANSQDNYSNIDSRYLTTTYTDLCKWMKLASTGIEGIEFYREHYGKTSDNAILDYDLGQCYFNRALAYWHAQIFFELNPDGLGFAKIDRVISDVEGLKLSRETVRDTWQFMIDDCNKAVELLKGHTEDEFRATEWAAKGLLAKVYMQSLYIFPENRDKTKALLEDIIQNSGKHLVSNEIYKDMFFGNEANEHNAESLYELTMTSNSKQTVRGRIIQRGRVCLWSMRHGMWTSISSSARGVRTKLTHSHCKMISSSLLNRPNGATILCTTRISPVSVSGISTVIRFPA